MTRFLRRSITAGILGFLLSGAPPLAAQQRSPATEQELRRMSQAEVVRLIRDSGMSRQEMREQLRRLGYSTEVSDRYFDMIDRGESMPSGVAEEPFVAALEAIGLLSRVPTGFPDDTLRVRGDSALTRRDSLREERSDTVDRRRPRVFGRDLFARATSEFQSVTSGPVDPGYRVGPGDELIVILYGNVELAYQLPVTREGAIVIPDVGQVFVNGVTLGDLQQRLAQRMVGVYAGLRDGSIQLQVSLGRLRSNQVFLTGEVERPGAYQLSATSTVFNALYQAGGPAESGSFRRIFVRRGGAVIGEVDVYDYVLRGDSRADLRLEQGDILFVPVVGPQVAVEGGVRRPAIFELAPGDQLADVLEYAGGLESTASVRRIQIDRVLPPGERRAGMDRVLIDVELDQLASGAPLPVAGGDVVHVFNVSEERRNRVAVLGEVNSPGIFEWRPGSTLRQVIDRADGLTSEAYVARAHLYRLDERDGSHTLIQVPLEGGVPDLPLADRDSVVVFSGSELRNLPLVVIQGFVKEPGEYPLANGMTVRDLILAAGGFTAGAYGVEAEVARRTDPLERGTTLTVQYRVPLLGSAPATTGGAGGVGGGATEAVRSARRDAVARGAPDWSPFATDFALQEGDFVFVRRAPGYDTIQRVVLSGEVQLPGTYALESRQERLDDLLRRAGGLTAEAFPAGLRIYRDSLLVPTDLERALRDPGSASNLILEPGDSLDIPHFDPTVTVVGAVGFSSRVLWVEGKGLDYYINQAGGYLSNADKDRVILEFANGERGTKGGVWFLNGYPDPGPGSTIFVQSKPDTPGVNVDQLISRTVAAASAILSAVLVYTQLR